MPTKSITVGDNSTRLPPDQIIVDITNYVFHYEISPDSKVWERAKTALFDALGCVFETLKQSPEASTIIGPVVPETIVPNGFKLPGTSFQLDPIKGAFDLGFLIRYVDHNDAFPRAEWGHPSGEPKRPREFLGNKRIIGKFRQHWGYTLCGRLA